MSLIANAAPPIYLIGDLLVDVGRARVTRGDQELALPKLSLDLLLALIERSPAIVSPDELMAAVWPGLVVSPETISQRIKLLRGALDDDSKEPRYIAGVRGRGYRLVPVVERIGAETGAAATSAESGVASDTTRVRSMPAWQWVIACVALLALVIAVVANLREPVPTVVRAPTPPSARSVAVMPFASLDDSSRSKVLALGISESLLHQLASLRDLSVIARTSSFAPATGNEDARAIGARLNAHYLLEGSVQYEDARLRVTAQLVDTTSGEHLWSMRFDRASQDVFAVQDEIAIEVARALKLSLDAPATDRLRGRRTANLDAYFAYLKGRTMAATLRLPDLKAAAEQFALAIKVDPDFAAARVGLAAARLHVAEFEFTEDRQQRFEAARVDGQRLIAEALALDPTDAEAYAVRAYLRAFTDIRAAEADYRRSIELSPSNAAAFEGLAAVLYETLASRDEALAMLDRARALDPLEPRYDVTKAVFLMYWRGQIEPAAALLREVIERDPLYQPALMRYGEIRSCLQNAYADGIMYLEQAIELDPSSSFTLSFLSKGYLDIGEPEAAANVIDTYGNALPSNNMRLQLYRKQWRAAAESAYIGYAEGTIPLYDEPTAVFALRLHARATREYERARQILETRSGVTWDSTGAPHVQMQTGNAAPTTIALGDILIAAGQPDRGRALLRASLADLDRVALEFGRNDFWDVGARALVLAMLGDEDASLAALGRDFDVHFGFCDWWALEIEPAFAAMRDDPRFKIILAKAQSRAMAERALLQRMRAEGLVPQRP